MKIFEIITESDILVPNNVPNANKVVQLNSLVTDFFTVVKIQIQRSNRAVGR